MQPYQILWIVAVAAAVALLVRAMQYAGWI